MVLIYQQLPLWFNGSCCCDVTKPAILAYEHRLSLYAKCLILFCIQIALSLHRNTYNYGDINKKTNGIYT